MRRLMLPTVLLAVTACEPAAVEQHATTSGPDVEAITAWLDTMTAAVNAGDTERLMGLYADDALSSPPDATSLSVSELQSMYEGMFGANTFQFTAEPLDVVVSGDLGVLRVSYESVVTPKGEAEPITRTGTWLVVLRKQTDGRWTLWREMWSVVAPEPADVM